jgi:hypothetical protein
MTLNMAKQAQRQLQSERRSSGAARGDYEAFVPSKNVWTLLVAAWKTTSPREGGRYAGLIQLIYETEHC